MSGNLEVRRVGGQRRLRRSGLSALLVEKGEKGKVRAERDSVGMGGGSVRVRCD